MPTQLDPDCAESRALFDAVRFDGARVLEAGCGDGRLTFRLAPACRSILAIDSDGGRVRNAARGLPPDLKRVRLVCASATALPVAAESFDIAVLSWSL